MKIYLLPHWFALIGLILFLLAFIIPIGIGIYDKKSWEEASNRRQIALHAMVIGAGLMVVSRKKVETEHTTIARYKSFVTAAWLTFVILPFQAVWRNSNFFDSGFGLILLYLLGQIIVFHFLLLSGKEK